MKTEATFEEKYKCIEHIGLEPMNPKDDPRANIINKLSEDFIFIKK